MIMSKTSVKYNYVFIIVAALGNRARQRSSLSDQGCFTRGYQTGKMWYIYIIYILIAHHVINIMENLFLVVQTLHSQVRYFV